MLCTGTSSRKHGAGNQRSDDRSDASECEAQTYAPGADVRRVHLALGRDDAELKRDQAEPRQANQPHDGRLGQAGDADQADCGDADGKQDGHGNEAKLVDRTHDREHAGEPTEHEQAGGHRRAFDWNSRARQQDRRPLVDEEEHHQADDIGNPEQGRDPGQPPFEQILEGKSGAVRFVAQDELGVLGNDLRRARAWP